MPKCYIIGTQEYNLIFPPELSDFDPIIVRLQEAGSNDKVKWYRSHLFFYSYVLTAALINDHSINNSLGVFLKLQAGMHFHHKKIFI